MAVEVQRTLDHFERQYRGVAVAKVLLAPTPKDIGLAELLRSRLGIEFQPVDLRNVLVFDDAGPDAATQWRLFHHFGAALRHESKAL
jgi:MSHA biogenesis protein MshI